MVDNNGILLNLLKSYKEECSPTNIKVEEVEEEIIKTETEVSGGSWVYLNVDINELLANEKRNLENFEEQLLNENAGIRKEISEDNSKILESINNLSTKHQKGNGNGLDFVNENMQFNGNIVEINNEEENLKFQSNDNNCLSISTPKKRVLVSQKKCEKDNLNHAKDRKQMSVHNNYNATEKKYKCNECSYATERKDRLLNHIQARHTMEKPYKCDKCSYAAVKKCNLLSHIQSHHTKEKPYKCNECSYAAGKKDHLLQHIKFRHTIEKPYKCDKCCFTTKNKYNLLYHIKSYHTMEKPHKCNECSFATVIKSKLLFHIKVCHTSEKPYQCNECSYAAVARSYVLAHIQSCHTKEKRYKCNECSYAAAKKYDLLQHIKSHHT